MDKSRYEDDIKKARAVGAHRLIIATMQSYVQSMELLEEIEKKLNDPQHITAVQALDTIDDSDSPEWLNAEIGYFEAQGDTETVDLLKKCKQARQDYHKGDAMFNAAMDTIEDKMTPLEEELVNIRWELEDKASAWLSSGLNDEDKKDAEIIYDTIKQSRLKKLFDTASYFEGRGKPDIAAQFNRIAEFTSKGIAMANEAIDRFQHQTPKP